MMAGYGRRQTLPGATIPGRWRLGPGLAAPLTLALLRADRYSRPRVYAPGSFAAAAPSAAWPFFFVSSLVCFSCFIAPHFIPLISSSLPPFRGHDRMSVTG